RRGPLRAARVVALVGHRRHRRAGARHRAAAGEVAVSGEAGVVVAANPARVLLLTGVAITAWLVHLALSAAAVPLSCTWASTWPLHLVTVLTLAVAVACALVVTAGRRGRRRASNGVGAFYTT